MRIQSVKSVSNMEDVQYCNLRYSNHQSDLIFGIGELLFNNNLVDCTLAAEGKFLKAHKVVLSACSPYFSAILSEQYDKHPIFMLKDVTYHQLKAILDYIYNGEVNIPQDQVDGFFRAAEFLQIKGLLRNSLEDTIIDPTEPSFKEEKSSQDSIFALDRLSKNVGGDLPLTSRPVPPLVPRRFDPLVPSTSSEASTSSRKRTRRCRSENKDTHFEDPAIAYPSIVLYEHNEWEHESKNFLEEDINNMGFEIPTNPGTEFSKTNDLRPYGCDCGRSYKNKGDLKKHQTHECGVEPAFCCDYCSKKFKRQWDLKMHVSRRHVPKKNK